MISIRSAHAGDAAAIAEVHARSWRETYAGILSEHYLQHALAADRLADWQTRLAAPAPNQYTVVAQDPDGTIVGFACAYGACDKQAGTLLENLHAHPQLKQRGIGSLLLRHVAHWNREQHGALPLHLWVVSANAAAIGFYRHMGGQEDAHATWDAPDGSALPELRFTWYQPDLLLA